MATNVASGRAQHGLDKEETKVIFASSLGTIFEWYDFYLYAVLAPFFAALFFPPGNATAALLSAFAAYAAGFLVRPFGALVFGRVGDLVGRKYTFLVTIMVMGFSTFAVGLLPTYSQVGWLAPILMVSLRLLQGLALGGEYGGAATYVAEHAKPGRRGFDTAWIQTSATLGLFLALLIIGLCRFSGVMTPAQFAEWGWRLPFLVSLLLLIFSIYIRLKLNESPVFKKMKAEGKGSKQPLTDSFLRYPNNKLVLLTLLGATAGQGVVWYTGQFYALFFLTITLRVDGMTAYTLIAISLLLGTPFFIVFGALSDKIGRLKIILAGCLIAALTFFPLFQALTHYVNPALETFAQRNPITVQANECSFHVFVTPFTKYTDCDRAKDYLTKSGLSFKSTNLPASSTENVVVTMGTNDIKFVGKDDKPGWNEATMAGALVDAGYPGLTKMTDDKGVVSFANKPADKNAINWTMTLLILFVLLIYVTMVYGPIAAFLVELFPTRIRYTSMSLPYHIGNGWFGGMLPLLATAMVAASGDIYYGLWYPIVVALMTVVVGTLFLRDNKDFDLHVERSAL
ncbi:MAG: MFS transporter [Betaproteobacteria bacterium]